MLSQDGSDLRDVICQGCGGVVRQTRGSEISLDESDPELPGVDLVRDRLCYKQVLCWSCMNDSITQLLSN